VNIKDNKLERHKIFVSLAALITMICELPNHFKTRLLRSARLRGKTTTAAPVSQPPGEDMGYVRSVLVKLLLHCLDLLTRLLLQKYKLKSTQLKH